MITQKDIIYFIVTDRFAKSDTVLSVDRANPYAYHGGSFMSIIDSIPYLHKLGITTIRLTPIYLNIDLPEQCMWGYHGYWPLDFERISPYLLHNWKYPYSSHQECLRQFVDELHKNGFKVMLDFVVGHTGYNHPGLTNSPNTPIKSDWFTSATLESFYDQRNYTMPELNLDNIEVIDYIKNNILYWASCGVDCINIDSVRQVDRAFWQVFNSEIRGYLSDVSVSGDALHWSIDTVAGFAKYFAFDYLFDHTKHNTLRDVFIFDKSPLAFAYPHLAYNETLSMTNGDAFYTNHHKLISMIDNHDCPSRFITEAIDRYDGDRQYATRILKLALTYLLTAKGIPQIYYGDEIGLEGYSDPDNRRDMAWEMFDENWDFKSEYLRQKSIFMHTSNLISIRKQNEALIYGDMITLYVDSFVYAYLREFQSNIIIVVINNGHLPMNVPLLISVSSNSAVASRVKNAINNKKLIDLLENEPPISITNGNFSVQLAGKTAKVYKVV